MIEQTAAAFQSFQNDLRVVALSFPPSLSLSLPLPCTLRTYYVWVGTLMPLKCFLDVDLTATLCI